jgi:hypothetical protein
VVVHAGMLLVIVLTVIYIINGTTTNPWNYISIHIIMRILEFVYEIIVLGLTQTSSTANKQTSSPSDGAGSSNTTVGMTASYVNKSDEKSDTLP